MARWPVGQRVRYAGKPKRFMQETVIGARGVVRTVMDFDYPYIIELDEPQLIFPGREHERIDTTIRTGAYGWERVT